MLNFSENGISLAVGFKIVSFNESTNDFIIKDSIGNMYIGNVCIVDTVPAPVESLSKCVLGG